MNKIFILFLFGFLLVTPFFFQSVSADLGAFPRNSCVSIRTISNISVIYLGHLTYPNGTTITSNSPFNNFFTNHDYNFCNTTQVGVYVYDWVPCDTTECVNSFRIENNDIFKVDFISPLVIVLTVIAFLLSIFLMFVTRSTLIPAIFLIALGFLFYFNKISALLSIIVIIVGFILTFVRFR